MCASLCRHDGFGALRKRTWRKSMRKAIALAMVFLAASALDAAAQTYPSRTITIVVPYPAGGPTDTIARILAERMKDALGQTVIVENVAGAGGSIGVGRVAHASP